MTRGAVLITGASSGIGKATALHLDGLGFQVFAGVRQQQDAQILQRSAQRIIPLQLDVTNAAMIAEAVTQLKSSLTRSGLVGLVNNAGIAVAGPLEFVSTEALRQQFEVNVIGQFAVTRALLPLLRSSKGRVIMMSSIGGRVAIPMVGAYSGSKFALEGLSDALRRELAPWGIFVSLIEPGQIATPIWDKSTQLADELVKQLPAEGVALYGARMDKLRARVVQGGERGIAPLHVAKAVEKALTARRPSARYLVGNDARSVAPLARFLPDSLLDWILARAG